MSAFRRIKPDRDAKQKFSSLQALGGDVVVSAVASKGDDLNKDILREGDEVRGPFELVEVESGSFSDPGVVLAYYAQSEG